ncbi:MAG: DUF429 domain-containing protein [Gammaproteobacteria bacterium]|nr:DUF429 domain-containing protein [Gammaproteobacteria bacterium]
MSICIIGIDCATDPKKVGLARGFVTASGIAVDRVGKVQRGQSIDSLVCQWVGDSNKVLLAIDAPLGWPAPMGDSLANHKAGDAISTEPNLLFRRETDRFIKQTIGKQPLDVGADRIARTAHSALKLIGDISAMKGCSIPLAWNAELELGVSAIEVYPAATLKVSGYRFDKYKKKENRDERLEIIEALKADMDLQVDTTPMANDDDALDAVVCVLAGYHFIKGECIAPENGPLAKKEGWIWVKG